MTSNLSTDSTLETISRVSIGARQLFYLVTPAESSFEKWQDVPKYVDMAFPFFALLMVLEMIFLHIHDEKPMPRWNDAFSSITAGILSQLPLLLVRNIEVAFYIWVYNNYRLFELPWDSSITWFLAFLGVDLGYYWVHRMAHEVNFMWAAHQVHHSSEDYNLSTALRQSVLQRYNSWIFYLPLAFFIPPSHFVAHVQFNLVYQFWIHTEVVRSIGPLEYIMNTASHHRVHHGRNRYCIDKNYAGVLIIWDRIFGTFAAEDEEVVYGLVHPLSNWNPIYTQLCHWQYMITTAWNMEGLGNKISVFWKGPGWSPGKPRMGELEDIPDIKAPQPKYDKALPLLGNLYCWLHLLATLVFQQYISINKQGMSQWTVLGFTLFLVWTLTNLGFIFEHKWYGPVLEFIRCTLALGVMFYVSGTSNSATIYIPLGIYLFSLSLMVLQCARTFSVKAKKVN